MKALFVLFSQDEVAPASAFAASLGIAHDTLVLFGGSAFGDQALMANLSELPPADSLAEALVAHVGGYTHVISASTMRSKDVLARLAGLADMCMVTDAIGVVSPTEFGRPIVAGSMLETVEVLQLPVAITFRPSNFKAASSVAHPASETTITLDIVEKSKRVAQTSGGGSRPDLGQARVIVSGGRPLKDSATFESLIGALADALGGAAGATRAAVDSGIVSNELQIGQTGKIVAPELYIAAGISGSTQHMAGMKDSKTIVAINTDGDAPIFSIADFGIVGDLFQVIPELKSKLSD